MPPRRVKRALDASNFANICRVCTNGGPLRSIFEPSPTGEPSTIGAKMRLCSGLAISPGDGLPDKICDRCLDLLDGALRYRQLSESADKSLRGALAKAERRVCESLNFEQIVLSDDSDPGDTNATVSPGKIVPSQNNDSDSDGFHWKTDPEDFAEEHEFFSCPMCLEEFDDRGSLNKHMAQEYLKEVRERGFKCYGCEDVFKNRYDREIHEDLHCSKLPIGTKYHCRECHVVVRNRHAFDRHIGEHKSAHLPVIVLKRPYSPQLPKQQVTPENHKFICEVCGVILQSQSSLKNHVNRHTGQQKQFKCGQCDYKTRNWDLIQAHIYKHQGLRPFTCQYCPYTTDIKGSLKVHERLHKGIRPYKCSHCDYTSINSSNLKTHVKMKHGPTDQYRCYNCGKCFDYQECLKEHRLEFHRETVSQRSCETCGSVYKWRKGLLKHMKKSHPEVDWTRRHRNWRTKNVGDEESNKFVVKNGVHFTTYISNGSPTEPNQIAKSVPEVPQRSNSDPGVPQGLNSVPGIPQGNSVP